MAGNTHTHCQKILCNQCLSGRNSNAGHHADHRAPDNWIVPQIYPGNKTGNSREAERPSFLSIGKHQATDHTLIEQVIVNQKYPTVPDTPVILTYSQLFAVNNEFEKVVVAVAKLTATIGDAVSFVPVAFTELLCSMSKATEVPELTCESILSTVKFSNSLVIWNPVAAAGLLIWKVNCLISCRKVVWL